MASWKLLGVFLNISLCATSRLFISRRYVFVLPLGKIIWLLVILRQAPTKSSYTIQFDSNVTTREGVITIELVVLMWNFHKMNKTRQIKRYLSHYDTHKNAAMQMIVTQSSQILATLAAFLKGKITKYNHKIKKTLLAY